MSDDTNMRDEFEAHIRKDCGDLTTFGRGANMHYLNSSVNHEWIGWQAAWNRRTDTRAAALEEAARVCDGEADEYCIQMPGRWTQAQCDTHSRWVDCAKELRSLAALAAKTTEG